MQYFTHHRIVKTKDGYIAVLYLDRQSSEFAKEFDNNAKVEKERLEDNIREYIKEKLPNIKVKAVNIMLGSLLVASLPLASLDTSNTAEATQLEIEMQKEDNYTVNVGDTLYKIANRFNITVDQLKSANGLTDNTIYIGQNLKIPNIENGTYTVKSGDTLFSIAQKYNLTVEQLRLINELDSNIINIGQNLYIPSQELIKIVNGLANGIFNIGDRDQEIKNIQQAFNILGYSLIEDGVYGSKTQRVILDFQSQYNTLTNDGIYGPKTKVYLQKALLTDHIIISNPSDPLVVVNKNNSLPSDYIPNNLTIPDVPFAFEGFHQKKLMRQDAAQALESLFKQAKKDNIDLYAISGYRSYDRQEAIFTSKTMIHGLKEANKFSAKPGESEHQTGLAMDVTSPNVDFSLTQHFGKTKEGKWLKENAPKFGFVIRYPEGKEHITGYEYEPWHLRYVGRGLAEEITYNDLTLEEYLGRA